MTTTTMSLLFGVSTFTCLVQAWTLPVVTTSTRQHKKQQQQPQRQRRISVVDSAGVGSTRRTRLSSSSNNSNNQANTQSSSNVEDDTLDWRYYSDDSRGRSNNNNDDWLTVLQSKQDGSFWTSFAPSQDDGTMANAQSLSNMEDDREVVDESDAWLATLAALSAEEVQFNQKEGERADMLRKMEEYKFSPEIIAATLGVATDTSLEDDRDDDSYARLKAYRKSTYEDWDPIDLQAVESHALVPLDPDNPATPLDGRTQMVYVDEHTCIGCTNCAMVAQSTFFMHPEHGRARVFQQWGDDEETIQIAIETCPVDCIHYVPFSELINLEKERRNQNINFKARLVAGSDASTGLYRNTQSRQFSGPQRISGNSRARCNNCPSRGCGDCPMYGIGRNPEFEAKEKLRLAKRERRQLERQRETLEKKADL